MNLPIDKLFSLIDFLGVFVGALGGALAAVRDTRYKFDLVGVTGLALASALGGGITRDLVLQKGPPLAFADPRYLMVALDGAAIGMMFAQRIGKNTERAIIFVDAAALGLFAVSGSTRALNNGLGWLPALLLGATTAVGGGCIRDVLSGRTPKIFERGELYAIAATFGAAIFLACDALKLPREISTALGSMCGFGLRLLAMRFHLETRSIRTDASGPPKG
ncbi:MAG TPA: trimeric intracellular cation channel family protein [Candidatus Angelobacter sp.]|nr:trimeric intracellular cation channel family protein [Candidatus Angelobacter sp.]